MLEPQPGISSTPARPTIAARFERLPFTGYQRKLGLILATCFTVDAIDLSLLSFLLAPVSHDLGLDAGSAGLAGSACFAGMGVAATIAGAVGDRFGRRRVLVWSMLLWGTASLLTAFSWDLWSFVTFRFVTGLGLGAELPVAIAMLAEFMPASRRARATGWMEVMATSGQVVFNAASLAAITVAGAVAGWRAMFVVMFLTSLFALYVRRRIPESPRWLLANGQDERADEVMSRIEGEVTRAWGRPLPEATAVATATVAPTTRTGIRELFAHGYAKRTVLAWSLWLVVLLAFYGINTWVGKLLVDRGMSIQKSILVGLLVSLGAVPGAWVTGVLMDRLGRKPVVVGALVLVAGIAFTYGHTSTFALIVIVGALMQFALTSVATSLYAYTPELFPTRARSTGLGTSSTAGRVSAIAGPLLVPWLVLSWGYGGAYLAFAVCFLAGALLLVVLGPETRSRVLEEVSA